MLVSILPSALELQTKQLKELIVVGVKGKSPFPIEIIECQPNLKYHLEDAVCSNVPPTSVNTILSHQTADYFWKMK